MHNTVGKIMQSKNIMAIKVTSWTKAQLKKPAILVIAYGVLMLIKSDSKQKLYESFNLKSVRNLLIAENTPSAAAFELDEELEAKLGTSHIIIETTSLGLLMRYILDHYFSVKLDFTDTISLNTNGCMEEFSFEHLNRYAKQKGAQVYSSKRFILPVLANNSQEELEEKMSSEDEFVDISGPVIKTIMCGELLELRIEGGWFQKNYIWEPHLYQLTNIGILKFKKSDITQAPSFMPFKDLTVDLLPVDNARAEEMIFRLTYTDTLTKYETEIFLSSEHQNLIVDWINSIKLAVTKFNPHLFKSRSQIKIGMGIETLSQFNSCSQLSLKI